MYVDFSYIYNILIITHFLLLCYARALIYFLIYVYVNSVSNTYIKTHYEKVYGEQCGCQRFKVQLKHIQQKAECSFDGTAHTHTRPQTHKIKCKQNS